MALKPEVSVTAAISLAAIVYAIHSNATPPMTDIRSTTPGTAPHSDVNRTRRQATVFGAATVGGISLIAKDPTLAIAGWGMVIGLDWWTRYSNEVYPAVGRVLGVAQAQAAAAEAAVSAENVAGVQPDPYAGLAVM